MAEFDPKKYYRFDKKLKAFVIDIPLDRYLDLYNDWDFSPLRKRDLDDDFHDYLVQCSIEIPFRYKLNIHFHLPAIVKDTEKEKMTCQGFKNYFEYRIYKSNLELKKHNRQISLYIFSGVLFLVSAFLLQKLANRIFLLSILPEGLFIGGWVLFWEAFSIIFFKTSSTRQLIKRYHWIKKATLTFSYLADDASP